MAHSNSNDSSPLPILYSYRDCPFCVRARLAIAAAGVRCELREVVLPHKPDALLAASPKGTVPVVVLPDGSVIDESMDVIHWALEQSDPMGWRQYEVPQATVTGLLEENDRRFVKAMLAAVKPEKLKESDKDTDWHHVGLEFFAKLERKLEATRYLAGNRITVADICIVPFIQLYADAKPDDLAAYPRLGAWLEGFRHSDLYRHVMQSYPAWQPDNPPQVFP